MPDDHRRDPRADDRNPTAPAGVEEFTVQQAANLLNVNRKYLQKLLDDGHLPCTHTPDGIRIRAADFLPFKRTWEARRREELRKLTHLTEELGGYERELRSARHMEATASSDRLVQAWAELQDRHKEFRPPVTEDNYDAVIALLENLTDRFDCNREPHASLFDLLASYADRWERKHLPDLKNPDS